MLEKFEGHLSIHDKDASALNNRIHRVFQVTDPYMLVPAQSDGPCRGHDSAFGRIIRRRIMASPRTIKLRSK